MTYTVINDKYLIVSLGDSRVEAEQGGDKFLCQSLTNGVLNYCVGSVKLFETMFYISLGLYKQT